MQTKLNKKEKVELIKLLTKSLEIPGSVKGYSGSRYDNICIRTSLSEFFSKIAIIRKLLSELNYLEADKNKVYNPSCTIGETVDGEVIDASASFSDRLNLVKLLAEDLDRTAKADRSNVNKTSIRELRKKLASFDDYIYSYK